MKRKKYVPNSCVIIRAVMVKQNQNSKIPIEIGIEKYENGCLIEEYASFCKPETLVILPNNMPSYITHDILQASPPASEVARQIRDFVGEAALSGEYANEIAKFANLDSKREEDTMEM